MTIDLAPDFEQFINSQVNSGIFSSTGEALDYAYRLMRERDLIRKQRIMELNADIDKGLESAEAGNLVTQEELMEHIKKRRQDYLNG